MRLFLVLLTLAFLAVPVTLTGCGEEKEVTIETDKPDVERGLEKAGEAVEKAGEKTGEALDKAGEETREGLDKADKKVDVEVKD